MALKIYEKDLSCMADERSHDMTSLFIMIYLLLSMYRATDYVQHQVRQKYEKYCV